MQSYDKIGRHTVSNMNDDHSNGLQSYNLFFNIGFN